MSPTLPEARAHLLGFLHSLRDPWQQAFRAGQARRARTIAELRTYEKYGVPPLWWSFPPLRARLDYYSAARKTFLVDILPDGGNQLPKK